MHSRVLLQTCAVPALAALTLLSSGCTSADSATQAESITVDDAWVQAADSDMTAAFGLLTNAGDNDVRLLSATSPASGAVEIHEVVQGAQGVNTMRPKEGGLLIPADGELELRPGADHLMLIDLHAPLTPGTDVEIVTTFEDGSRQTITAQVRDFPGADEHYAPEDHAPEHSGSHG